MEKETYCVVVVQFDNGVKRTTEVMPKELATQWVHKYGGRAENCEVFECTPDGEHLRKLATPKMELGGGVEPIKNPKGEYALYPESPTKKSMGLLLEYGGTMNTSEDMSAPTIGGTMGSSMRTGGNVGSDWQVMFESRSGSGKVSSVIVQASNLAEAKSKGWVKSGLDKKYFAFLTAYEKKEFGGNTNSKKNDNDDISQYYDMEFALGGGVPNQKQREIITQKIGLSEKNADYLIGMSPKFAVWFADMIVKDEAKNYTIGSTANVNIDGFQGTIEIKTEKDAKEITLKRLNVTSSYIRVNYNYGIRQVLDWLMHPLTPKQNLRELSFADAIQKSVEFHKELQALGGDINFVEDSENEIIKRYPLTEEGVEYYWVGIPSGYCDIESKRMGHCGRTGHGGLISLRSIKPYGKGHTINDSHVTIAYDEDDNLFYQVKGKKNQKPAEKYHPYIYDLIKTLASDPDRLFKGFGSEYASSEDYGFDDMSVEQIEELNEINKYIFYGFAGQLVLYKAGLIEEKPITEFIIEKSATYVDDLLNVDRGRRHSFVADILEGDLSAFFFDGSWGYYRENIKDCLENLNADNEQRVVDEVMRLTKHKLQEVLSNGVYNYLIGNVEGFHEDEFDEINRALANAHVSAEETEYLRHYKIKLKDALDNLGVIKKLNYEGVIIEIDLSDLLSNQQISTYMKDLGSEELADVFWEAVEDGSIDLPNFYVYEQYTAYAERKDINIYFASESF